MRVKVRSHITTPNIRRTSQRADLIYHILYIIHDVQISYNDPKYQTYKPARRPACLQGVWILPHEAGLFVSDHFKEMILNMNDDGNDESGSCPMRQVFVSDDDADDESGSCQFA